MIRLGFVVVAPRAHFAKTVSGRFPPRVSVGGVQALASGFAPGTLQVAFWHFCLGTASRILRDRAETEFLWTPRKCYSSTLIC